MADPTYIACPRCGEPYAMTVMQKRLFHGRTLACQRCAKPFMVTEETPDPVAAAPARARVAPEAASPDPASATADAEVDAPPPPDPMPDPKPSRKPGDGMTPGRMALLIAAALAVTSVVLYFAMAPAIHRSREAGRRASCATNLQQLGMALQMYANTSGGQFPDSLDALVSTGTIPAEMLVCPSSNDTVAPGANFAEQGANISKGKHVSYVYVGKGLTYTAARQLLVYEPLSHHDSKGVNALFSDGTVQFLPAAVAFTAIPQLAGSATLTSAPISAPSTAPSNAPGG